MKAALAILITFLAGPALAGQKYLQPMEPSNSDHITLLPSAGGKINLDGAAFFQLPNGERRSLQGLNGSVDDLIDRFDDRDQYRLRYERLPTKAVDEIRAVINTSRENRKQTESNKDQVTRMKSVISKNSKVLSKVSAIGNIVEVRMRDKPEAGDGLFVDCPEGHAVIGALCLAEIQKNGKKYWEFTQNIYTVGSRLGCRAANPAEWVNAIVYCVDTGFRSIYRP